MVPAAGSTAEVQLGLFHGWEWKPCSGIKILGAPIGDESFCAGVVSKRAAKAQSLLDEIAEYGNTQGALMLLRHCASWGKLVYVARTVPPSLLAPSLTSYGLALRRCLENLVGE